MKIYMFEVGLLIEYYKNYRQNKFYSQNDKNYKTLPLEQTLSHGHFSHNLHIFTEIQTFIDPLKSPLLGPIIL